VVRLAGLTKTRPQARQGVAHGHFLVNGRRTDIPSMIVRIGDVIAVKQREQLVTLYRGLATSFAAERADWLSYDEANLRATVLWLPSHDDITLPVDVAVVVELLSR
jgi:small subunit ribosomal protein S4